MRMTNIPDLAALQGLWTRLLLVAADGARDVTTWVGWLQGPGWYADLRQPQGAPDFSGVRRLADVTPAQLAWMARQEAFAGELCRVEDYFEWRREIDLQPRAAHADRGRLGFDGQVLVERGVEVDYFERWHRDRELHGRSVAARLQGDDGANGYLIRYAECFMYVRAHQRSLPPHVTLFECVCGAPSHEAALRLLDLEVAFGRIDAHGWIIERSSLPFRRGQRLGVQMASSHALSVADSDFARGTRERIWEIVELRGSLADLVGLPSLERPALSAT
jgi:hypothetical protein